MIRIMEALKEWRVSTTALNGITFRLESDLDQSGVGTTSQMDVSLGGTETRAVVPFTLIETLTVHSPERLDLLRLADTLVKSLDAKQYFGSFATIHRHVCTGVQMSVEQGLRRDIVISWEGTASWL